jgi:uncharacterized protein YciI
MPYFALISKHGEKWIEGKGSREQAHWDGHATFMEGLFSQGKVVLGGPFADYSQILVVIEGENRSEVQSWFENDPWVVNQVTQAPEIHEWLIFLDRNR